MAHQRFGGCRRWAIAAVLALAGLPAAAAQEVPCSPRLCPRLGIGRPWQMDSSPPGSEFSPAYPSPGPVSAVPAFQWGYFGARSQPWIMEQRTYHDDARTIGFPRRY
jgi:hypothetical protein